MYTSMSLNQVLLHDGLVTQEQLQSAIDEEAGSGRPAPRILVERGVVAEKDLVRALARQAGLLYVDVLAKAPEPQAVAALPAEVARRQLVLPIRKTDEGQLLVAMAEPNNQPALHELKQVTGLPILAAATYRPDLRRAIAETYGVEPPVAPETRTAPPVAAPAAPTSPAPAPAPGTGNGHSSVPPASSMVPGDFPMVEAPSAVTPDEAEEPVEKDPNLVEFLEAVINGAGSDLHLTAGLPPMVRVFGVLKPIKGYRKLVPTDLQELIFSILTQKQRERFEENLELDVSYALPGRARFRVNVFQQRDAIGSVMRLIPYEIKDASALGLPPAVTEFTKLKRGLVLVTGITGSGKSTTLAALVDRVNSERAEHIMTVEDPIEFLHKHKKAVVNQREVGADTHSFATALKHVLRQDPDVILVGELRDLETISTALTAAETGHLVFATLHTQDAPQSIDRIIDVFSPEQQQQVRIQLAGTIAGVVSQQLLPLAQGKGRAVAVEILVATPAVRNLIREGKTHQIYTSMQAGASYGMQVMDQHLAELVRLNTVTYETALEHCHKPEEFNRLVGRS